MGILQVRLDVSIRWVFREYPFLVNRKITILVCPLKKDTPKLQSFFLFHIQGSSKMPLEAYWPLKNAHSVQPRSMFDVILTVP